MLGRFKYKVQFASTGKTLQGDIDFQAGLSGISGANEKGKSTVLELIRWALFGTGALRVAAAGYKAIDADLTFTVKDTTWRVVRTKSNAQLFEGKTMVTSSTSAVNAKIEKIFGYGLEVFDIAHFCGQGAVEALTAMKPLERKKMIDRVIGLESLDVASASVSAEATALRAEIKGMELGLGSPPQPPVQPKYTTARVRKEMDDREEAIRELGQARAWLQANPTRPEPAKPVDPLLPTAARIRAREEARDAVIRRRDELARLLINVPEVQYSLEQLDEMEAQWPAYEAWMQHAAFVRQHGEPPTVTEAELDANEDQWRRWNAWTKAKAQVDLLAQHKLQCPECGHAWATDPVALIAAEEEMAKWEGVTEPTMTPDERRRARMAISAWAGRVPLTQEVESPALWPGSAMGGQRKAHALKAERAELNAIVVPASHAAELRERESYDRAVEDYEDIHERWIEENRQRGQREITIKALEHTEQEFKEWHAFLHGCLEYDALHAAYVESSARYACASAALTAKKEELEQLTNAADAVKTLRAKIKQYLTPSLNVAASNLISRMTGGQREDIAIDENFETILVDGQPVETLSGSGKAVANLAIRLGLGQVLTNKVFSVFLGDEIDASMDADRADYTAECLKGLNSVIDQIILVSHKDLAVQHQIKIG